VDLLGQVSQITQLRAARRRGQQDLIGAAAVLGRQLVGPVADVP
jgi:hypothetical protein